MLAQILGNLPLILAVLVSIVSEAIAVRQLLKYPDNDGVGGVLAGILKALLALGAKPAGQ